MAKFTFGKLEIDPVTNPSVLNTGTWDTEAVARNCAKLPESFYAEVLEQSTASDGGKNPEFEGTLCHTPSIATHEGVVYGLLEFSDGQTAFLMIGSASPEIFQGRFDNS